MEIRPIGYIKTDFEEKFGIPRQSGLIEELKGEIVFEPEYHSPEAFRGLLEYEYLWIFWGFSENRKRPFNATVKPPRLGGNKRMGVFATRSPYHPNNLGLSCVKLLDLTFDEEKGPVLTVGGVDMLNGTPVYDVKPYIPYTDSHPEAKGGFAEEVKDYALQVEFPESLLALYDEEHQKAAVKLLSQDPRPAYQEDGERSYGVFFAGYDIHFKVNDGVLKVYEVVKGRSAENEVGGHKESAGKTL
ncbi:MAG: tRNA (N6-threonylcarbamoyladenosine(37)-N6)-methyltransferase TrmO [Lachnospiraceae bacterium]|jgi:tRNA-Thr(GGU) m(6)t(6)A37 methyltransferase TsaA|nr:tRNA (N6-threonylcarbamoyladenosine(37)-N6)-methyltransferase TrmO [Lachnospiraceae bacterium]